ncbi:MAG: hypothetical protein K5857_10380 [Lachnospiraceae bacterium]|nr:hypothetical protein [Lachnospiraceae bacterium]
MKKLVLCISMGLVCMGLSACEGTGFDPAVLQETTETIGQAAATIEQASQTIDQVSESFGEIEKYVGQITESMQVGIDSTNAFFDWYENDAIPENPWINPPITDEEVQDAIMAGQREVMAYIEQNVDKNSTYDALSQEDIDFFNEYFADDANKAYLYATYEKPDNYDADKAGARVEEADCDLICGGGFFYNDIYSVLMKPEDKEAPFAVNVLSKDEEGNVTIYANYWSDDLTGIDWNGSFIFYLYEQMLNSDIKAVMSIPGLGGDITLGSALDAVGGLKGKAVEDALELVSDEKDKLKTYVQEFEGYDVYYSNLDPEAVGEYVVSQIDVTGGDFKTAEGIGIGSDIDTIRKTYGEGLEARISGGRTQLIYEMGKYNMLYILDKTGKVSEMTIFLADDALLE